MRHGKHGPPSRREHRMIRSTRNKPAAATHRAEPCPSAGAPPTPPSPQQGDGGVGDRLWFAHLLRDDLCQELAGISLACETVEARLREVAPVEARVIQD